MSPEDRVRRARGALWVAFLLSVALNWADELWHPVGAAWLAVRIAVSALFAVALIVIHRALGSPETETREPGQRGRRP